MDEDILIKFGKVIQALRKENGMTQEGLAAKTKFHSTYIGRIERGKRNLSLRNIETFSKAFDVHIKELFNRLD